MQDNGNRKKNYYFSQAPISRFLELFWVFFDDSRWPLEWLWVKPNGPFCLMFSLGSSMLKYLLIISRVILDQRLLHFWPTSSAPAPLTLVGLMSRLTVLPSTNHANVCAWSQQSWVSTTSYPSSQKTRNFLASFLPSFLRAMLTLSLSLGLDSSPDSTLSLCSSCAYIWTTLNFTWMLRKTLIIFCPRNYLLWETTPPYMTYTRLMRTLLLTYDEVRHRPFKFPLFAS